MYILYGGKLTRSALVEQVLAECEVEYELREIDTSRQEQRSPEFLKINPAGWVPALVSPQGKTFYETPAINLYLAEKYKPGELAPVGADPDRGLFLSGLFYITGMIEPAFKRYWFPDRYAGGEKDAEAVRQAALGEVVDLYTVIDNRLSVAGPFHLGERFSLVDLTMAYWSEGFVHPDNIDHLSAVKHCYELVYDRPKIRNMRNTQRKMIEDFNRRQSSGTGGW